MDYNASEQSNHEYRTVKAIDEKSFELILREIQMQGGC